jgi:hypothetical protein
MIKHVFQGSWLIALLCFPPVSMAQATESDSSVDELALELMNPVGDLASLSNRIEYTSYQGDLPAAGSQDKWYYTLTPTLPIGLSNGKNIVVRAALPISFGTPTWFTDVRDFPDWLMRQYGDDLPEEGAMGLGHGHLDDVSLDLTYGGTRADGLITLFGLSAVFPTGQDYSIARDQYLLGPEVGLGKVTDWGIIGARAKHLVNITDANNVYEPNDYDTSETRVNVFFAWRLGNGWQLISHPEVIYDWEAASGNKLILPLGGGVSKTVRLGRMPMKMDLELYGYLESPETFGPEWTLRFSLVPLLPNWFNR